MSDYELILFMWIAILTLVFIHFVIDMLYRTKKLKDTVDNLYSYFTAALEPQIKRIREVVNNEIINKKEGNTNTCLMPKEGRTMQIMIEIPDEEYENVKKTGGCYYDFGKAIYYGTPLPKGHGDLIDRSKLKTHYVGTDLGTDLEVYLVPTIDEAPIIIEADKAESEVEE